MNRWSKYVIGSEWPDDSYRDCWLCRLRHPVIYARVEPVALAGLRLHYWPALAAGMTTPNRFRKIMFRLAEEFVCHIVDDDVARVDFVASEAAPPARMVIDNDAAAWSGIVEPARGILHVIESLGDSGEGIRWLLEFGRENDPDMKGLEIYYREFRRRFAELPEEEDDDDG